MDISRAKPKWKLFFFGIVFYFVAKYTTLVLAAFLIGNKMLSWIFYILSFVLDFPLNLLAMPVSSIPIPLGEHPLLGPFIVGVMVFFYFADFLIWGLIFLFAGYLYERVKK